MKTFAFKNRLFLTYTVVITLVVALFSCVLLITSVQINRRTELYHQQDVFQSSQAELESILRQMDRLATQVVANNEILGAFIPLADDGDTSNYFAQDLIDAIRVSSLLSGINSAENFAARLSLFNGSGDYISTGTLYETPEIIDALLETPFYSDIIAQAARGGQDTAVDIHYDTWSNNENIRLLSLYRPLASFTGTVYGLVDVQVSTHLLDSLPFWRVEERVEYLLVDSQGRAVYPFDVPEAIQALLPAIPPPDGSTVAVTDAQIGRDSVILLSAPVESTDWQLVRLLQADALSTPYVRGYVVILLASFVLLLCLILLVYYLAARISRPLGRLASTASNVNLLNMQQAIAQMDIDYDTAELNALSSAMHDMLIRLDQSVSMEIQAHMRALQSQMNPHFLYNMLSVIVESSEEENAPRTVSMCMKLSHMLRYIADFSGDSATLADEVRHARNYLDLMKDRYEEHFTYTIEADDAVDHVQVPKILIQPLVENSFSHGFRNCRPPWHIHVRIFVTPTRWRLVVSDNGTGITPEAIAAIHEKVETYRSDVATNYASLKLGGMGLVNTLLRLSLSQRAVTYEITINQQGGTTIEIGGERNDTRADR